MPTVTDNFNRADGLLTTPWEGNSPDGNFYAPTIASNVIRGVDPGGYVGARWAGFDMSGAQEISLDVPVLPTGDDYVELNLCQSNDNRASYSAYVYVSGGGVFEIYLFANESYTLLGAAPAVLPAGGRARFTYDRGVLNFYNNGVLAVTATDGNLYQGKASFGVTGDVARLDNVDITYTPEISSHRLKTWHLLQRRRRR